MDWKLCFCSCSICKKQFLAPNGHYSLCSRACRAEQNKLNKREFDARSKEKDYEMDYRRIYHHMHYRLNSLKAQENVSEELRMEADNQFKAFRKEAIRRKKTIKTDEDRKAYQDWLFEEEKKFEKTCVHND